MEDENFLGIDEDDRENMKIVVNDLIDMVVKFNGMSPVTEADWSELKVTLDFADFVVSGIIYSNGFDLCANHGHDAEGNYEEDDDEGVE